jgi:TrmH family RNA methyltransferase
VSWAGSDPDGSPTEPIRLSSASQNQLRAARRLVRRRERAISGLFLAEGPQAVREALSSPGTVHSLLVARSTVARHHSLIEKALASGVPAAQLTERDLAAVSDTVSPQGIVAICRAIDVGLAEGLRSSPRLVVCCAQIRDPGNAGTVIRTADAFGADAVLLTAGSVDAYNAKTVRATAGSLFHLPLVVEAGLPEALEACRQRGLQVLAADGAGEVDLDRLGASGELARPTVWVLGNEAWGLPAEQLSLVDRIVRVPIYGAAESLNLSTAAAVCLYATSAAQHSTPPPRGR